MFTGGENAPKYVERYQKDKVETWKALERSAEVMARQTSMSKKELSEDAIFEALGPIKQAMRKTDRNGRIAIIAFVNEYLLRGSMM